MTSTMKKLKMKVEGLMKTTMKMLKNLYVWSLATSHHHYYTIFLLPLSFPPHPGLVAHDPGAERPITTSRDFGSEGLDLLDLDWGLSGVEGGR